MAAPSRNRFVLVATLAYGAGAFSWILGSDLLVAGLGSPELVSLLGLLKGGFFVLVTTLGLFFLLRAVPAREAPWPDVGEAPGARRGIPWPSWAALPFAVGAVFATLLIRLAITLPVETLPLLILFVPAIVASALLGGLWVGLLATLLSVLAAGLFLFPVGVPLAEGRGTDLLVLLATGALISVFSELTARRRHLAEARRQMYRVTLDSIGDAVIATDVAGIVTFLNPAAETLIGWRREDAVGQALGGLFSILSESDRGPILDPVARVITAGSLAGGEAGSFLLVGRDGRERPIRGRATAIRDRADRLFGVVLTLEDGSERRAAEVSLAAERRLLRTLLDTLPDLVWLKDIDGRFIICNRTFERFMGRPERMILGQTDYDMVPPDLAEQFRANDQRAISAGMPVSNEEWITFAEEGQQILLETLKTPMRGEQGEVVGVLGIGRDITARFSAETALRHSVEKLSRLAASVPGMLYEYAEDPTGAARLLYVSDYCRPLFGLEPAVVLDSIDTVRALIVPEDFARMRMVQQAAVEEQRSMSVDVRVVTPDGQSKWVQFSSCPAGPDRDGMVHLRSGVALDITGRVRAEAAVREKDELLREMSRLAHIGAWSLDLASGTVTTTEEVAAIHDLAPGEQASVSQGMALFQGEHRDQLAAALQAAREEGCPYDLELEMETRTGIHKWVRAIGAPVMDAGRVVTIRGTLQDITARKLASLHLAAAEARLRLVIETAPVALALLDRERRFLVVSRRWLSDYRLETAEVIGSRYDDLFPETSARWLEVFRRCLAGASEKKDEDPISRPDGTVEWLRWEVLPWRTGDGTVGGLLILSENITERVMAREMVRKLSLAVEQSPNGIQITNADGVIEYVNAALLAMTGYKQAELIGRNPSLLSSGLTPTSTYAELWRTLAEGQSWQGELISRRKNGEIFIEFDRISPVRNVEGEITHYLAIKDDITERKRTAQELELYRHHLEEVVSLRTADLRAAEMKWRLILESSADGLYGVDAEGGLTFANSAACTLLGARLDEIIGGNSHLIFHHSRLDRSVYPEESCPITLTLRDGVTRRVENEVFWRTDGIAFPVSYAVHPIKQDGAIIGAVISFTDITAQIETSQAREAALAEAQRLAQVRRDFLANMSHEIRTPLNAILGLAQLGRADALMGERPRGLFARILDSGEALLDVVNDVLDFARIEAGKVRAERVPLVLGAVIDRALGLVASRARQKGLRVRIEEAADLPARIEGDPSRLTQVLGNLLSNAVKFTPSGGVVVVSVAIRDGRLSLTVSDSGIGMTAEQIGRLFQPFEQADSSTTRHFGGSGLGLSICHHLLSLMGGEVAVESALGQGTRFTVTLPLQALPDPLPPAPRSVALIGLDDESRHDLEPALRARGCAVQVASGFDPLPESAILVVAGTIAVAETAMLRKLAALGRKVLVALDPLTGRVPTDLAGVAVGLDWPWRARHVLVDSLSPAPPVAASPSQALAGLRVLAAEDNEVNRLVLGEMLAVSGARLTGVSNGREALEILERDGAAAFDLVLTDIQMPEMDGYDLARHLVRLAPDLPVIGITAHALPEEEERCRAAGMVAQITKPVHLDRLVEVILSRVSSPLTAASLAVEQKHTQVDWEALSHHYQGRDDFITRLMKTVGETHAATPAAAREAGRSGDALALAALAHKVKGTAGNLFAEELVQQAAAVERLARAGTGPVTELARAGETLAVAVEALLEEIATHGGRVAGAKEPE